MTDRRLLNLAPGVVGALLLLESFITLVVAMFVAIIGGFTGALTFVVSGSEATDEQLAQGSAALATTIATPFVVAAALWLGGVLLMLV